jgi:quinol monooxygenase YgiN
MIAVLAKIPVKAGSEADFEKAMLAMAEQVRANEPGNHLYTLCKDADGGYTMMELYEDEAAIAAHRDSAHFKAGGASLGPYIAGAPEITSMQVIG